MVFQEYSPTKKFSIEEIKKRAQILLIDDESLDPLTSGIREAGWNVRQIADVKNLDCEEVRNADIIFVDYKDVGGTLAPKEEGIGLIKALRGKYPSKHIIFFSGFAGVIPGHEVHGYVNGWIHKSADLWVYLERIEEAARKQYGQ